MELSYNEIINHSEVKTTSSLINLIHGMEKKYMLLMNVHNARNLFSSLYLETPNGNSM